MPSEIKPKYAPRMPEQKLGYLIEECGEVLAACGKTVRHGWDNYNPEVPKEKRETNLQWILRELVDLKRAIALFEEDWLNEDEDDDWLPPGSLQDELRQLVERERQAVYEQVPASLRAESLSEAQYVAYIRGVAETEKKLEHLCGEYEQRLPAWAKPVMRAAVGSVDVPAGTTGAEWDDAIINAVDALTPEQREEIMRDD